VYIRQYTSRPSSGLGSLTAPFEGTFVGKLTGDANSTAAVSVALRQQGTAVEGEITLGAGLQLDFGGVCGLEPIDLRSIPIKGQTAAENAMKFTATTEIREPTTKFGATHVVATLSIVAVLKPDGQSGTATIVVTPVRTEPKRPLIGCKSVTREVTLTKQAAAPSAPLQGLGLTPSQWTDPWKDLILFVPPAGAQKKIRSKCALGTSSVCVAYWAFHRMDQAVGDVNLDYYDVRITQAPTVKGVSLGPDALLAHIRTNLNSFIDPSLMRFLPFDPAEQRLWLSNSPLGALLRLDFYLKLGINVNIDEGTVVVSDYSPRRWRVYTLWNLRDHGHPVSGAREWGHAPTDDRGGYVIYTRGADRLTKTLMIPLSGRVYAAQRAVWISFQQRIAAFVNANGGRATIGTATDRREPWPAVVARYGTQQGWLP
jgi:hypothetical protein